MFMKRDRVSNTHLGLWQTTYLWLNACGSRLSRNYCKEEITTHPNYPSLLSVIDFLEIGGMGYKAVQADASYIYEFNYPLLAHIKKAGNEYIRIIQDSTEWNKQQDTKQSWTGVVVYPEINAQWKNEQHRIYRRSEIRDRLIWVCFAITGGTLFFLSVLQCHQVLINTFGLLSFQSQTIKQICDAINKAGCEAAMKSTYARGVAGATPSDLSIIYFSMQFVIYLTSCLYPYFLRGILSLAVVGTMVAVWSIYVQAWKLKQWCALCLAIVVVLFLQSVVAFVTLSALQGLSIHQIFFECFFSLVIIVPLCFIYFPVKKLLKENGSKKLKLAGLKKWKLNGELFMSQWKHERKVDVEIWENDLLLGNPDAPVQITVACNPYCWPCAKAHGQLDDLLQRFDGKIKVQIRLLHNPESNNDKLSQAVRAILRKASTVQTNREMKEMLSDWFSWMDYDKWIVKWRPINNIENDQGMKKHSHWVKESNISYTPTFFINGRQLPEPYTIADVGLLIPQLAALLKEEL
jgi:uncharacterized membrane protein